MRRVPHQHQPAVWNVHQATLDCEPRINNQCESWNNCFTHLVGYHHPSEWTMIDALKKYDAVACTHIAKELNSQPPKNRIRREYNDLQNREVAHNIRWKPVNRENDD